MQGIVYIEEPPVVTLDANGATLEYRSGNATFVRRYSRALWRRVLERELIRLNDWERVNRPTVVELRRADH